MIDFYNEQVGLYGLTCLAAGSGGEKKAKELIAMDAKKIKWTRGLIGSLSRNKLGQFDGEKIGVGLYRPFSKLWVYYDRQFNEYFKEKLYPTAHHENLAIMVPTVGISKDFSCLMAGTLPDLNILQGTQCFPLYYYEKAKAATTTHQTRGLLDELENSSTEEVDSDGFTRKDAITDVALTDYRIHYQDDAITKEDMFYAIYGILHAPDYRTRYANDLKKMLPRIPMLADKEAFWAFSRAGRQLADLHLNYESLTPYEGLEVIIKNNAKSLPPFSLYHVEKMAFAKLTGRERDKSIIEYNPHITIKGIPVEAYDYVVNGKPAIEWVMERYRIVVDKDSGIKNDPNDWCREHDDPEYIFRLVQQVVGVSVETVRIVSGLAEIM
ncbi:MAG: hypothetical protein B7Z70_13045 [Acidithiobacillus ferrivorans]|uniref:Type ISP restriction-modification enzyme LLaBIII C-terminal specificity domain-containing protein n=1 Tax=Acidithiobacillus ferrivorans TaxID=160808 RepID=A0A257SKD1_9PROT|nr:MAG: hypothetical protein B7Z70_13045 [Acidithiobacillus ferrivorans]